MAKLTRTEIQNAARKVLEEERGGVRWVHLLKKIGSDNPETNSNSIHGAVHALLINSTDIVKVARGTYRLAVYQDDITDPLTVGSQPDAIVSPVLMDLGEKTRNGLVESDFYQSFADWLEDGADEVTVAAVIGGNLLRQKWGTPDVIGVLRPQAHDIVKFDTQIISAEIKIDPAQPVIAFGQAVAYRIFSHKSFIAVPNTTAEEDLARLKALCSIHGIGLVTFSLNKEAPDYSILVPAQLASPDMFYVNEMARRILAVSSSIFKRLFP